jgi:hypothetical protein
LAIDDSINNLVKIIENYTERFAVLLFKHDFTITVAYFPVSVDSMEVETFRVRALMSPQEV